MASISFNKKLSRKLKRFEHVLERETGIHTCLFPTKNIAICNAGLSNGLTEENLITSFLPYGSIYKIILLPGKSCGFVCFNEITSAINAYDAINGKLLLGQNNNPLYLLYSESVPENDKSNESLPAGLILLKDFISEEEETALLSCITWDEGDSSNLKHRNVKHYGFEFRYDINSVDKNSPLCVGIPEQCNNILQRFCENTEMFKHFRADQLTVNKYEPGQGIPHHVDTHSAFEDPILSLSLNSGINMEFRDNDDKHISLLLPQRSLLVMSGESRYAWRHGITPRKFDIIPTERGLTVQQRGLRISFTFRKVLMDDCHCKYVDNCDSYLKRNNDIESKLAKQLESTHVHKVYEEIATHFSDTRHKPWPNVLQFINSLPDASLMIDIGCGNGKYLGHNNNMFQIGCDRSLNLIDICNTRGFQVFNCNCLKVPLRDDIADGVISIAVIHHLANEERRLQALKEIVRVLRVGGQALIYVWAKDQQKQNKNNYLKQNKKHGETDTVTDDVQSNEVRYIGNELSLPVHVNRTQFQFQDVLVPWKLKHAATQLNNSQLFLRFYHVFDEGELEGLCAKINNCRVVKNFHDQGNWCIILQKIL